MKFAPTCPFQSVDCLVVGRTYAVSLGPPRAMQPLRPVRGVFTELGSFVLLDPDVRPESINVVSGEVTVLGEWDGRCPYDEQAVPRPQAVDWTWEQYHKHAYGQVLRQRALAARLTAFGIPRKPEPYLPVYRSNAVERSLTLNYDELDKLLDAAGVPAEPQPVES